MADLKDLENKSLYIIREAYYEFKNPAALWSTGKDSTSLLHLCRKAFFGKIPFPVIHIDTGFKFKQMYRFRDEIARKWGLKLIVAKNEEGKMNINVVIVGHVDHGKSTLIGRLLYDSESLICWGLKNLS